MGPFIKHKPALALHIPKQAYWRFKELWEDFQSRMPKYRYKKSLSRRGIINVFVRNYRKAWRYGENLLRTLIIYKVDVEPAVLHDNFDHLIASTAPEIGVYSVKEDIARIKELRELLRDKHPDFYKELCWYIDRYWIDSKSDLERYTIKSFRDTAWIVFPRDVDAILLKFDKKKRRPVDWRVAFGMLISERGASRDLWFGADRLRYYERGILSFLEGKYAEDVAREVDEKTGGAISELRDILAFYLMLSNTFGDE